LPFFRNTAIHDFIEFRIVCVLGIGSGTLLAKRGTALLSGVVHDPAPDDREHRFQLLYPLV